MPKTAVALGSNLSSKWGDRAKNLEIAVDRLAALGHVEAVSSFYDTAPVGYLDQPRFLNGVVLLGTELGPPELLHALLVDEREMGRDRWKAPSKGPRIIDLDLLLYGDVVVSTEELTLPHPEMHRRLFVLEPLAEIMPRWKHPILQKTAAELLQALRKPEAASKIRQG